MASRTRAGPRGERRASLERRLPHPFALLAGLVPALIIASTLLALVRMGP
jgi:hypothetical protein